MICFFIVVKNNGLQGKFNNTEVDFKAYYNFFYKKNKNNLTIW